MKDMNQIRNKIIEREFLLAAPPSEVLKYFQEKAKTIPDRKGPYLESRGECDFPEETITALMERNERIIDIGLALVIYQNDLIEQLLDRYTKDSVTDSALLAPLLSNKMAVYYHSYPIHWLGRRIEGIVKKGKFEHIQILFSNPYIPDIIVRQVLFKRGWCKDVCKHRYASILSMMLENPQNPYLLSGQDFEEEYRFFFTISKNEYHEGEAGNKQDFHDRYNNYILHNYSYEISGYWNILLNAPVDDYEIRDALVKSLPRFHELTIPFQFSKSINLDENKNITKDNEKKYQEYKAFIDFVITRWTEKPTEPHNLNNPEENINEIREDISDLEKETSSPDKGINTFHNLEELEYAEISDPEELAYIKKLEEERSFESHCDGMYRHASDKYLHNSHGLIKKYTVQKIQSSYLQDLKDYLLSKNDFYVTWGYFAGAFRSDKLQDLTLDQFQSYLRKYKCPFLLGLMDNKSIFLKTNTKLGRALQDAVDSFEENNEDNIDEQITLNSYYKNKIKNLSLREDAERYITGLFDSYDCEENIEKNTIDNLSEKYKTFKKQ